MGGLRSWVARVKGWVTGADTADFEGEWESHRDLLVEDYLRRGWTHQQAESAATRELGNRVLLREEYREQRGLPLLSQIGGDLRYGMRSLRRAPGFTTAALTVLGVGLGGTLTIACVLWTLVLRPLPYPDSKNLVFLHEIDPRATTWPLSEPTLRQVEMRSRVLSAVGGYRAAAVTLTGAGEALAVPGAFVTGGFMQTLGMTPVLGQLPRTDRGSQIAVVSRELWRAKWAEDPSVLGRAIRFDDVLYTIGAVADFPQDLLRGADVLLPLSFSPAGSYSAHELDVVGRLRPGVSMAQAQAELESLGQSIAHEQPRTNTGWTVRPMPLFDQITGPATVRSVWMLMSAVVFLWILACANVAGLLLARGATRKAEIRTRFALGASRSRVFRQMLTESFALAVGGSAIGLTLTYLAVSWIAQAGASLFPRLSGMRLDGSMLLLALISIVLSTLLFGTSPAWSAAQGGQGTRGTSQESRGRDGLVVVQVALASVLLLSGVLLLQSFLKLRAVDPGYQPEGVFTAKLNLPEAKYKDDQQVSFFRSLSARLAQVPGVMGVGATNVDPFSGMRTANRFRLENEGVSAEYRVAGWRSVTPGYFRAMGLSLKRGRLFTDVDGDGANEVVIISDAMARRFWPGADPLNRSILWGKSGNRKQIIGVVSDLRDVELAADPAPMMFRPHAQLTMASMTLVVRTKGASPDMARAIREQVASLDPELPIEVRELPRTIAKSLQQPRSSLVGVLAFASTALLIAGCGLFGLVSYRVNQRRKEIGIRLALGASPAELRWQVQQRCLALVGWGLLAGVPLGYLCSRLMQTMLYRTKPTDVGAYLVVIVAFLAIALLASFGPAQRAAKTDPAITLRCE